MEAAILPHETLTEILNVLRAQNQQQKELWTTADIEQFMTLSKSTVQQRIIASAGFPAPVRLPTSDGLGGKRWVAKEIKQWVLRHR
jgi:predicted DNA-binding transcriptional regulator AlpA